MIGGARHHEQQIRQAIQIDDDDRLNGAGPEGDDAALGAAAYCAGEMKPCTLNGPAGENEPPKRRQLLLEGINGLFEPSNVGIDHGASSPARRSAFRAASLAPTAKSSFGSAQRHRQIGMLGRGARGAETRVQLVDLAVRIDAGFAFETLLLSNNEVSPASPVFV